MKTYSHEPKSSKGKAHPEKVGIGMSAVKKLGGSNPPLSASRERARSNVPTGVVRGDGTERRKGTTVKHLTGKRSGPASGGDASSLPGGVRKHSGLNAPKRVR